MESARLSGPIIGDSTAEVVQGHLTRSRDGRTPHFARLIHPPDELFRIAASS
jgi:hypothetical protein